VAVFAQERPPASLAAPLRGAHDRFMLPKV